MPRKQLFTAPRKRRAKAQASAPAWPKVIETYGVPRIDRIQQTSPEAFNGMVFVERYRITIEKIEEPKDVLLQRLRELWETTERNHHLWGPIRQKALELGVVADMTEAMKVFDAFRQGIRHKRGGS